MLKTKQPSGTYESPEINIWNITQMPVICASNAGSTNGDYSREEFTW